MRPFHAPYSFFPESTGSFNIGKDDLRWLEGFFTNLNISVRATVPTPVNDTDATTKAYVDARIGLLTVDEADGSPSIAAPTIIRFDQADGFVLTNPSTGVARIDLNDIPYATIQDVAATDRVLGRSTAGAGVIEEIVCTAAGRALLDDATAAAQRTTLGSTTVGDAVFIAASAAAARTTLGVVIGTDVQAWDADLDALAALAATAGMLSRTGAGAFTARTLTAPAAGFTISDATGAAGNPTFVLANDLSAVEGLGTTGLSVRSAADTWLTRSVAGTASNVSVANGDGVAGNPTVDLVNAGPGATGPIGSATVAPVVTIDAKGRVTALTSATITAGLSAATQTQMEAATSNAVAGTPGTTQYHPGVAKFWASWPKTTIADDSYNLTSIADTGAGDWTLTIGTDFSSANWCSFQGFEGNNQMHVSAVSQLAGTVRIVVQVNSGVLSDPDGNIFAGGFGDQA